MLQNMEIVNVMTS